VKRTDHDALHRVVVDCRLTRRKYFHVLQTPDGDTLHKDRMMVGILDYMLGAEIKVARLQWYEETDMDPTAAAYLVLE
jgi:hypothetical protein